MSLPSKVQTLPSILALQASRNPTMPAFRFRSVDGPWLTVTWLQFGTAVTELARMLEQAGLRDGARIGILGANGIAWELSQHAVFMLGGTVVGLDPLYAPTTLSMVMSGCELTGVIVFDAKSVERIPADILSLSGTVIVVTTSRDTTMGIAPRIEVVQAARPGPPSGRVRDPDSAIVVFSSGTTGVPKPIAYSHAQTLLAVKEILARFPDLDRQVPLLCWLPLSNLFQRVINFCALHEAMCSHLLEDPRQVVPAIAEVEPEIMIGVPIFFDRVRSGMTERLASARPGIRGIASWALQCARRAAESEAEGRPITLSQRAKLRIADHLVLRRLRQTFGRRIRYLVSGSAPLSTSTGLHFRAIGLPIFEAYGVSENIVPIAMNQPGSCRPGTVGRIMPGNEVRIDLDGEILVRGPGVFRGYLNADADTPSPDSEGYWHTGDLGSIDDSGFLRVVGRKSDAFKLSTGKWIAPSEVESALRAVPWVDHLAVVGSGRKNPLAIISAPSLRSFYEASEHEDAMDAFMDRVAKELAAAVEGLASSIRPGGVLLVLSAFSIANGELTANLKVRRRAVESRYDEELSALCSLLDGAGGVGAKSPPPKPSPLVRIRR